MKKKLSTFLKGVAMGSVDIIPGISGGTMALILKIYDKILNELKLLNLTFFKNIFTFRFKKAFSEIDFSFLLSLFSGIIVAVISLAKVISWLLDNYPSYLFSLFLGLIIISAILLIPKKNLKPLSFLFLVLGVIIAWILSSLSPAQSPESYFFIFLSGLLAICAMILPGISGAFILLIIGKYEFMISALKNPLLLENLIIIIIFIAGCLIGLLAFSKFLNFLLKKYYQITLMLLIGFMLGSLNKIWPFKEALETKLINNQEIIIKQKNILPKLDGALLVAFSLMILGIIIGFLLSKIKKTENHSDSK